MADPVVKLRLTAESGQFVGEVRVVQRELDTLTRSAGGAGSAARQAATGVDRLGSSADRVSRDNLRGLNREVDRFGQLARLAFAVELARRGVQLADSWATIQSRLQLATGSLERYNAAQAITFDIAQRTFTALDSTASLYGRLQAAADTLGQSQATALRVTELINKSFQISGTQAAAASAAITQFAQGLDAGALRGDEFNSVMEQAPRLATALAKGLNVGRGELRAMAEDGKLTAAVIIKALQSQGAAIDAEFAKLPLTAGRAWQQLENVVLRTIGRINEQTQATRTIAEGLQAVAEIVERVPAALDIWITRLSAIADESHGLATEIGAVGAAWDAVVSFISGPAIDELMILPVSLSTLVTIAVGEFDKLRIGAGEQLTLLRIGGQRAWYALTEGATIAGLEMGQAIGRALDGILTRYASLIQAVAAAADGAGLEGAAGRLRETAQAVLGYAGAEQAAANAIRATRAEYLVLNGTLDLQEALVSGLAESKRVAADTAIQAALDEREAALKQLQTQRQSIAASEALGKAVEKAGDAKEKAGQKTRRMSAELRAYVEAAKAAERASEDLARMGERLQEQNQQIRDKLAGLTDQQVEYNATVREADAALQEAIAIGTGWMLAVERHREVLEQANIALRLRNELEAKNDAEQRRRKEGYRDLASAAQRYGEMAGQAAASLFDDWERLYAAGERRGRAYWDAMLDMIKRAVIAMVFEWGKTSVIGLFGGPRAAGGGSFLGSALAAFGGYGGTGMAGSGGMGGGNGSSAPIGRDYVAASGGGVSLFDGAAWVAAGRSLYAGFSQFAWGSGQMTAFGSQMGVAAYGPGMTTTYTPTGAGVYAGYAAGITGAYYGFTQRGNGGSSSVAAGLSYGALGLGAVGAVGGLATGAGAVAGATGAFASIGAASWIPVVGWILAILALIDIAGGGRLFGTKPRTQYADVGLNIGPEGGYSTLALTTVRQRSLFGGRDWDTHSGRGTAEMDEAARELFTVVRDSVLRVARATGEELGPMIEASLHSINKYDKRGNVIGTRYEAYIRGVRYEEDTAELAAARIQAEAILNQLGDAAVQAAERWRRSVESLREATALLVAVQTDISNGNRLFGEISLTQVANAVAEYQQGNESLVETYARLRAEVASLQDAFALAGAALTRRGSELVAFANAIAMEAGGGEASNQLWQGFFQRFYTQAELAQRRVETLQPQVSQQLGALGLRSDTSLETFRIAFERALPTLTAEQVVQWLRAADALATLNDQLGQTVAVAQAATAARYDYAAAVTDIERQIAALAGHAPTAFQQALAGIGANLTNMTRFLNEAARAAGLAGAREQDLARARALAAAHAAAAARQLEQASRDIATQLFGDTALMQTAAQTGGALQGVATGLESIQSAAERFRDGLLLDDALSPLNVQQRFDEAMRQLRLTGDESIGRQALELGRDLMASGEDYRTLFDLVTSLIRPHVDTTTTPGGSMALPAAQPATLTPAERLALAQQLAQNVADLSGYGERSFADVAGMLDFTLTQLGNELGLQGDALTAYLESLRAESYGLDDLSTVIAREVDRLIAAISTARGADLPEGEKLAPDTDDVVIVPPRENAAPAYRGVRPSPAATEEADTAALIAAINGMSARVEAALDTLVRVAAASGTATESGLDQVVDETRGSAREIRALAEVLSAGIGRTRNVLP